MSHTQSLWEWLSWGLSSGTTLLPEDGNGTRGVMMGPFPVWALHRVSHHPEPAAGNWISSCM